MMKDEIGLILVLICVAIIPMQFWTMVMVFRIAKHLGLTKDLEEKYRDKTKGG